LTCPATILAFWLTLPVWRQDAWMSVEERTELYRPAAVAVCSVGRTAEWRAFLAVQARYESALAEAVLRGHCETMGPGACDHGRAVGPWQVHGHCPAAWRAPTNQERLEAGARCALKQARVCRTPEGWFAAQSGRGKCVASWARERVRLMWRILAKVRERP